MISPEEAIANMPVESVGSNQSGGGAPYVVDAWLSRAGR